MTAKQPLIRGESSKKDILIALSDSEFRDPAGWHEAKIGRIIAAGLNGVGGVSIELLSDRAQTSGDEFVPPAVWISMSREDAGTLLLALERALL